jgi:hypothetical protein
MAHLYPVYNLAQMTVASSGTGAITLGSAYTGLLTFETAGCSTAPGGQEITYAIADSSKSEINRGVYYSSSMLLTRTSTTYIKTTNSDNPVDMAATALVSITAGAFDLKITPTISVLTSPGSGTYTPPLACIAIEVIGTGGGQGGQAGGNATFPSTGGDTTFAVSSVVTLTAYGAGSTTAIFNNFNVGGGASGGNILNIGGGSGCQGTLQGGLSDPGGQGGNSYWCGGGNGGRGGASPSTGSGGNGLRGGGGGGGSRGGDFTPNDGGGAGGTFWHFQSISSMSSALSFAYSVGAGSQGDLSLDGGGNAGNGGNGVLIIKEYYLG